MVPSITPGHVVGCGVAVPPASPPTTTVVLAVHELPDGVVAVTVYVYEPGTDGATTPVGFC